MTTVFYCDSDGVDKTFEVGEVPVVVGRAPDCAVRSEDPLVSRYHAQVFVDGGHCWIQDLDSSNGVYVGGERVKRGAMPLHDIVLVGSIVMQVLPPEGQAAPVPTPSIHSLLWSWLKMERKGRAGAEDERNALGHRVGEMHQALEQMQQAMQARMDDADEETRSKLEEDAAHKLAAELKRVRDSAKETHTLLTAIQAEKAELQLQYEEAKRAASSGTTKQMAEVVALEEERDRLNEEVASKSIECDDLQAAMRMKVEENAGLREDLTQLAQAASPEADKEQALAVAAQAEADKMKLADELTALRAEADELREAAENDSDLEISDLKEDLEAAIEEGKEAHGEVRKLSDELEALRWSQHQGHAEASRLKVQLEAALAQVGELRGMGASAENDSEVRLTAALRAKAELEERLAQVSAELEATSASAGAGQGDSESLRQEVEQARATVQTAHAQMEVLRGAVQAAQDAAKAAEAELTAARADAESAWAEVEAERRDGEKAERELESLRAASSGAESEGAALAADAVRAKADLEEKMRGLADELESLRSTCEMREQECASLADALRGARADHDTAQAQLAKAESEADAAATQPTVPAMDTGVGDQLLALEGFLGSLRRSMRAASDEAAVMPGGSESVDVVTDALTQATLDIENARDSLRELGGLLGVDV